MPDAETLGLFEGFGVELEYMIVDADSLDVLPISDRLLAAQAGEITGDVEFEDISWSNELVMHVVELKTTGPTPTLAGRAEEFQSHVQRVAALLEPLGARLLPTAMHPWMDPHTQMKLWPHDYSPIYEAMHRIFNCRGHGWANLQSLHLNLPFADDNEFGRLHAAIRLLLPILPGLAASSPIMDSRVTGRLDNRLDAYRTHSARVPSVAARIIPEPVFTIADYHEHVLGRIYHDIAPHDPDGVLHYEFTNARGAIARFERNAIEIRVIDVQECPAADLAIAALVIAVLKLMVTETWSDYPTQQQWSVEPLADLFEQTIGAAEQTTIANTDYMRLFGYIDDDNHQPRTVGGLWRHLAREVHKHLPADIAFCAAPLDVLLTQGPLARRILTATGPSPTHQDLQRVYGQLADCLAAGEMFLAQNPKNDNTTNTAKAADHL